MNRFLTFYYLLIIIASPVLAYGDFKDAYSYEADFADPASNELTLVINCFYAAQDWEITPQGSIAPKLVSAAPSNQYVVQRSKKLLSLKKKNILIIKATDYISTFNKMLVLRNDLEKWKTKKIKNIIVFAHGNGRGSDFAVVLGEDDVLPLSKDENNPFFKMVHFSFKGISSFYAPDLNLIMSVCDTFNIDSFLDLENRALNIANFFGIKSGKIIGAKGAMTDFVFDFSYKQTTKKEILDWFLEGLRTSPRYSEEALLSFKEEFISQFLPNNLMEEELTQESFEGQKDDEFILTFFNGAHREKIPSQFVAYSPLCQLVSLKEGVIEETSIVNAKEFIEQEFSKTEDNEYSILSYFLNFIPALR